MTDKTREYAPGNTDDNGDYIVGKGRTPVSSRFAKDDGRTRGRRPKGTSNFLQDVVAESQSQITITENGKSRRVSKQRAMVIKRQNMALQGDNRSQDAIGALLMESEARKEAAARAREALDIDDAAIIAAYDQSRLNTGPQGDPDTDPADDEQVKHD